MPEHKTIQAYLNAVSEQIRWQRARPIVTDELERHLEDQRDVFAEEGYTNAEEMAVEEMGDPVTVGTELDRIHRPKPQWGLIAITVLFALAGAVLRIWLTSDFSYSSVDPFKTVLSFAIGCGALIVGYSVDYTFGAKHIRGIYTAVIILSVYFLIFSPRPMGIPFHVRYVVLFFPVLYAFLLYTCHGKGWKGLSLAIAGGVPMVIICWISSYIFGGFLILLSGFVLLLYACVNDWFGIGRLRSSTVPLGCASVITGVFTYQVLHSEHILRRLEIAIYPETDPLGAGYYGVATKRVLALSKQLGEGTWNDSISKFSFDRYLPHSSSDSFLTTVIFKLGWIPFCFIMLVFSALILWMLCRMMQQKSQLGRLVVIAVAMTLLVQATCSLMWTLGITLVSSSFPLLTGNVNMVLNMTLIGLALSVFRGDSIARNTRCEKKTAKKYRIRLVIEKI